MIERAGLTPTFGAGEPLSIDDITAHLRLWRSDTAATETRLTALRQRVVEGQKQLENPNAAYEYLDFFCGMFHRFESEFDRVAGDLQSGGALPEHVDALRQIASNSAAEQRRSVGFRDKWINKPLPYEQMRELLTQIAADVRDQIADYRDLTLAATRLAELAAAPPKEEKEDDRGFDRRALFTRLIRPEAPGDEDK
jgi:hypothetical protein